MKKIFSLFLALTLLLSMAPAAFAAPAVETEANAAEDVPMEKPSIEIFSEEEEALEEENVQEENVDWETQARRDEAAARAEERAAEARANDSVIDLLAASHKLTIKVKFPQAATDSGQLRVYLYKAAEVDDSGFVTQSPYSYGRSDVSVSKGDKSATVSFSVPDGNYIPAIYSYTPTGSYLRTYLYFNKDGSPAASDYTADPIVVSDDKNVTINMPAAERTIGGTVHFSEALKEDTEFEVRAYGYEMNVYYYFSAEKGDTSFDFSIPVVADSYRLRFYNETTHNNGYYDIYGTISDEYDFRAYVSVLADSVSDLNIDGDYLVEEYEGGEETTYTEINVKVKLPEALTSGKDFAILYYDADNMELYDYNYCYPQTGATEITDSCWLEEGMKLAVGYLDITNWNSFYWEDAYPTARFLSKNDGITDLLKDAKVHTLGKEKLSITIKDTNNYKLSGTLKLSRAKSVDAVMFAMAEFEDGARYGSRVIFPAGETSVKYTIYVPKTQSGAFDHWAAEADTECDLQLNEDTRVDGDNYELKNKVTLDTITIPVPDPNVTGTVSLPNGMTAPKGGLALEFIVNDALAGYYYMAEGESSIDFAFVVTLYENNDDNYFDLYVLNAPENLCDTISFWGEEDGDMTDMAINLPEIVTVSGTITVPDTAKDLGTNFYLRTSTDIEGGFSTRDYLYVSVLAGKTTADYVLKVPKDVDTQIQIRVEEDATGKVLNATQYLQENGSFSNTSDWVTLNKDTVANLSVVQAKTITGKITVAEGLASARYSGQISAQPENGGNTYYSNFNFTGTSGTYSLAVPEEYTGTWKLYINAYNGDINALLDTDIYYSTAGMTFDYSSAASITAPATNIDFVIPKARTVSGNVILPEEFQDADIWGNVYAFSSDDNDYSTYFATDYRMNYSLRLPTDYNGTYVLAVRLNTSEDVPGLITKTYLYLTEDGSLSANSADAKVFTVPKDGMYQDLTVPLGQTCSVTVNVPEGFSGEYEGYLYLYDLSTSSESAGKNIEFNGTSTTVSLSVPAGSTSNYTLRVYMYSGPCVMPYTNYYYSNGTWVTDISDATAVDFSSGAITITLPKAKIISGKLVSAQGDAIQLAKDSVGFSLRDSYGSSAYCRTSIDTAGNFILKIEDDISGQYRLSCDPRPVSGRNVVSGYDYYYKSDATAAVKEYDSNNSTNYYFTVGEDDVTGLQIYVDTGYVLTGTVQLDSGATLSGSDDTLGYTYVYLKNTETEITHSSTVYMDKGATRWTYSVVVPKETATYSLSSKVYLYDSTTSNIYLDNIAHGTVDVSGPAVLPTITLGAGKHTVDVTITSPVNNYVSGQLYMVIDGEVAYEKDFSLSANGTKTVSIVTKPDETAENYQLYYYAYHANGIIYYQDIYLTADGTLTTDVNAAGTFSFDKTSHSITLMEQQPYAKGKIYIPEDIDDTEFTVYLRGSNSVYVYVDSDTIKTENDGRQYIPYALYNKDTSVGSNYTMYYYLYDYSGSVLYTLSNSNSRPCITTEGEIVYGYSNADYFTVPENGTTVLDFTLATWNDGSEENILQSAHGIDSSADTLTYTYTYPGASGLQVTFSERTDTSVTINGTKYYTYELGGNTKNIDVSGTNGTLTVEITPESSDPVYGFGIVSVVPYYGEPWVSEPTIASVYSEGGSTEEIVMSDLLDGKNVYVSMVAPENVTSGTLIAAIYDGDGKMLDAYVGSMIYNDFGNAALALEFETVEDAEELQIMYVNENWAPQMINKTLDSIS